MSYDMLTRLVHAAAVYETGDIALAAPEVQALMRELRPLVERDEARELAKAYMVQHDMHHTSMRSTYRHCVDVLRVLDEAQAAERGEA